MQSTVMVTFSVISISILILAGVMYLRFSALSREESTQSTQKLMEQTGENLEDYLVQMRRISDAVYYNVIKESDFSSQNKEIQRGMNILYEANKDDLRSIAVYMEVLSLRSRLPHRKRIPMSQNRNGMSRQWKRWRTCIFPHPMSRIFLMTEASGIIG